MKKINKLFLPIASVAIILVFFSGNLYGQDYLTIQADIDKLEEEIASCTSMMNFLNENLATIRAKVKAGEEPSLEGFLIVQDTRDELKACIASKQKELELLKEKLKTAYGGNVSGSTRITPTKKQKLDKKLKELNDDLKEKEEQLDDIEAEIAEIKAKIEAEKKK